MHTTLCQFEQTSGEKNIKIEDLLGKLNQAK